VLGNCYVKFSALDAYADSAKGDPVNYYIKNDISQASSTIYKRTWYLFKNVEYFDDDGFLFPDQKQYSFTNFQKAVDATDLRTNPTIPGSFYVISINNHNWRQKIYRSYYKLQNMIADLSSITKGILMIAAFLNQYLSSTMFYESIISKNMHNYISHVDKAAKEMEGSQSQYDFKSKVSRAQATLYRRPNIDLRINKAFTPTRVNVKLSWKHYIFPLFCFNENKNEDIKYYRIVREKVNKALDINTYITQINMVDKLLYILAGSKYKDIITAEVNLYEKFNYFDSKESMKDLTADAKQYDRFIKINFTSLFGE
jgi:hypothetical protein